MGTVPAQICTACGYARTNETKDLTCLRKVDPAEAALLGREIPASGIGIAAFNRTAEAGRLDIKRYHTYGTTKVLLLAILASAMTLGMVTVVIEILNLLI